MIPCANHTWCCMKTPAPTTFVPAFRGSSTMRHKIDFCLEALWNSFSAMTDPSISSSAGSNSICTNQSAEMSQLSLLVQISPFNVGYRHND